MQEEGKFPRLLSELRLGLGLAALGRPGYINLGHDRDLGEDKSLEALRAHALEVLDAAWAAGIRYYDVARSYGQAEAFLTAWLLSREVPEEEVVVGSKWGYTYTAGWRVEAERHEVKEHSLAVLDRQIVESRRQLGDHLRLYQIHSATLESGVLDNQPVLDRLDELKHSGLLIGLTLSGADQGQTLARAMEIERGGRRLFDSVQATWNVLEPSCGPVLAAAQRAGVTVMVKEALANGRLTERNTDEEFAPKRQILAGIARDQSTSIDAVALAAALAQPWAGMVLSGAARKEHLASNLGALGTQLTKDDLDKLAALAEPPQEYWNRRAGLAWN
jgi:aryl-alcohol dehydrogenase-like predicted oxidoreductase